MTYKFYRAQVTGSGYVPQGECKAILSLDEERNPTWTELSDDFKELCQPWFATTVRMGKYSNPDPLKPYSKEALEHLAKHQLPSQGYMMVKVQSSIESKPVTRPNLPSPGFKPPFPVSQKKL